MSRKRPRQNLAEDVMAEALDGKMLFDDISEQVLPILRTALSEGWDAERLYKHPKIELLLAARAVTIGIREQDSAKALSAIKDIQDRTRGKAVERIENTHKLEKLPDEQLDSLLLSKLGSASDDDEEETLN
jgi:hypothetical protein